MSKILAVIFCLFSILFLGASGFASDSAIISGRVTIENSIQYIYDAKLYLYNSYRETIDSVFTVDNGFFEFDLTAGEYYLSAEKDNYIKEYYPSSYEISDASKITVFANQNVSVFFSLDRGGWLGGIFDYVGRDIEKGLVTAIKIDEPNAGWNRSVLISGERPINYVLNGLIPGAYKVMAMASVKRTVYYPDVYNFEEAEIIYVERNTGVPDISFLLQPVGMGHVTGRVYDSSTGEGLIGISIYAYQWQNYWDDPNMQFSLTGEQGEFAFELPAGSYYFYLLCDECIEGYGRITFYYDNQYNPMLANIIEIPAGIIITDLDFALDLNMTHGLAISGNIVNFNTGMGMENVVVTAIDNSTGFAVSSTYSSLNGDYSLENLPSGEYILQYSGSNVIPFFYRFTESWQNAEIIILSVDYSNIDAEAITQDFGNLGLAIYGNVLTPNGPASGARIYAYLVGEDYPKAYGRTSASGEYSITTGLTPGSYNVVCDMIGYNYEVYPYDIHLDLLENPVAEDIDFLLQPAVTAIHGNIAIPGAVELLANYPNPFNGSTRIRIFSGSASEVEINLMVYNLLGQRAGEKSVILRPGVNYIEWNVDDFGRQVSSGVYFYRIEGSQETRRMIFLK
jgi:hypothetical protein